MNFSTSGIAAGIVFGVCGIYFLHSGRKEGNAWGMLIGGALLVYPYFVVNAYLTWGIGVALVGLAWYKR